MAKKLLTWNELRQAMLDMAGDELNGPVLFCSDDGYFGIEPDDLRAVPSDVDPSGFVSDGVREKDVVPGRRFISL